LSGHAGSIFSLGFNENLIVTGASDGKVKVWDFQNKSIISTILGFGSVQCLSFTESKLVVGDSYGRIKAYDFDLEEILPTLT